MQVGQKGSGMNTMNQSLLSLVQQGMISRDTALKSSPDQQEFSRMVEDFDKPKILKG